ncbi:hypothetical protein [Burkholderia mayonis]|uniref:hypothetical protein n=1 Tax=Burkholderia mayonis TaxID=1385591 RepID=UPI00131F2CB2|nr:hypothetical protein [Burkholderia mayonis]
MRVSRAVHRVAHRRTHLRDCSAIDDRRAINRSQTAGLSRASASRGYTSVGRIDASIDALEPFRPDDLDVVSDGRTRRDIAPWPAARSGMPTHRPTPPGNASALRSA